MSKDTTEGNSPHDSDEQSSQTIATSLGGRHTSHGGVSNVFAHVEVPDPIAEDGTISVCAFAYDDEPGEVQLTLRRGVDLTLSLGPTTARELGETLLDAANDAEGGA